MKADEASLCPVCGTRLADTSVGGLCAKCFARSALDHDSGWLQSKADTHSGDDWPDVHGWRITGVLGAGGMGRVYLAESEADERIAALKLLDARWSRDPLMVARFEAEAAALMSLDLPHIVRVMELTETADGRLCMVMEHVDGCDLGRLLRSERMIPERAMDIFQKTCAAVAHAHKEGFAHRDIKPANILIGRDGIVKLGDFGLAKKIAADAGDGASAIGGFTVTTDRFGTAYYLAPEALMHRDHNGQLADVYALGVLVYHLLTGQMPLGRFTPVSELTGLPKAFDSVIAAALEADPAKRTVSATELATQAANAWQEHVQTADRTLKRKRLVMTASALAAAASLAIGGALWQRSQITAPKPPVFPSPATASESKPWENSLGMKFVPVPGTRVLFSIWETRRRDVEPFVEAERGMIAASYRKALVEHDRDRLNIHTLIGGRLVKTGDWNDLGFPVTPDHPACFMLSGDGPRYCQWLTWKEQTEGRLHPGQCYRLPTAAEWLIACGGEDAIPRAGNVAGPEARDADWNNNWPTFADGDPYPRLSPVGAFPAELHGLYDMSGNVCEWVLKNETQFPGIVRDVDAMLLGPDFHDGSPDMVSFKHRRPLPNGTRLPNIGFRIVLDWQPDDDSEG